jgi:hypothetical protein
MLSSNPNVVLIALALPALSGCVTYHYIDTCTRSQFLLRPPWSEQQIPPMPSEHCEKTDKSYPAN